MQQRSWYIGKASLLRANGRCGVVDRFREHVTNTYKPGGVFMPKGTIHGGMLSNVSFALCLFLGEAKKGTLELERHLIKVLQAPMQDRVTPGRFRPARHRPCKRMRNKSAIDEEKKLNQSEK